MNCEQWSEQLSAWIDGMLTKGERKSLEAHLKSCEFCRQTAKELQELKQRLEAMPVPSPRPEMWSRVMKHVRYRAARKRFNVFKPTWGLAAVASIALLIGTIALFWQKPSLDRPEKPMLNFIVSYHADNVSLSLKDNPISHLIATAELSEAEGHE